jgi:uncharacterized protein YgfB (UPF0149 family)
MTSQINITFTGDVLDLYVELEGREVGLNDKGNDTWSRTLTNFKINGNLDISMLCKGINGTVWQLLVKVDGNDTAQYSGKIEDGYSSISDTIEIK